MLFPSVRTHDKKRKHEEMKQKAALHECVSEDALKNTTFSMHGLIDDLLSSLCTCQDLSAFSISAVGKAWEGKKEELIYPFPTNTLTHPLQFFTRKRKAYMMSFSIDETYGTYFRNTLLASYLFPTPSIDG